MVTKLGPHSSGNFNNSTKKNKYVYNIPSVITK